MKLSNQSVENRFFVFLMALLISTLISTVGFFFVQYTVFMVMIFFSELLGMDKASLGHFFMTPVRFNPLITRNDLVSIFCTFLCLILSAYVAIRITKSMTQTFIGCIFFIAGSTFFGGAIISWFGVVIGIAFGSMLNRKLTSKVDIA